MLELEENDVQLRLACLDKALAVLGAGGHAVDDELAREVAGRFYAFCKRTEIQVYGENTASTKPFGVIGNVRPDA